MSTTPTVSTSENKQAGMVAIMVTLILMIVISLIVLGFAQISRRTQRQSLDRQLSTQAFYAAETGINDVARLIEQATVNGTAVPDKTECDDNPSGFYSLSPVLDTNTKVEYTCVLVDASPPNLTYSSLDSTSKVIPIIASSGTIDRVTLSWSPKPGTTAAAATCPTGTGSVFSVNSSWSCGYGVIRFDIVPSAGGGHSISSLQSNTMSTHVVPLRPGSTGTPQPLAYTAGGGNNLVSTVCSDTGCSLTLSFSSPQSQYHMRVMSLYKEVAAFQITATSGGSPVSLVGAQAMIDVTGKAEDVLRRVQVRMPLAGSSTNQLSDYAMSITKPICKRFSVMDGFFQSDAENAVPGVGGVSTNPLCQ